MSLDHVYWLGGGSGAGKSTIARRLAEAHGMALYDSDAAMADHAARCPPDQCPELQRFRAMTMDQRWVERDPVTMLNSFHWYLGEGFSLIIEDLLALPSNQPILAEGFRLLPHLVQPQLTDAHRALWLLPTPEFRRTAFEARGGLWDIARKTSQPDRALANLLERDRLFTERLAQDLAPYPDVALPVTSALTEDALFIAVQQKFRLL
ncbi:MAG: shikimate kinase [Pseudomonadota bacterium]